MVAEDAARQLREDGIAPLRGIFPRDCLSRFRVAAARCFAEAEAGRPLPERYRFNRFSHSMLLAGLADSECAGSYVGPEELLAPLAAPGLAALFSEAMGCGWTCNLEHSWVRKKFAPGRAPAAGYHPQGWHQDGALGVRFPPETGTAVVPGLPMTELLTCWIPLDACGVDSPGLEFVRGRQAGLLHFTELEDSKLRQRFALGEFWAPELGFGDGLLFLNSVLHRTYTRPEMRRDRLSVEYRFFRDQGSEIRDQGSEIRGQGSGVRGQGIGNRVRALREFGLTLNPMMPD